MSEPADRVPPSAFLVQKPSRSSQPTCLKATLVTKL